jgi:hypothetical protein
VWIQHFGISGFGVLGFQMSNNGTQQFSKLQNKKKVELTFRDFGVQNPMTSKAKTSTTTIPEIVNRKECGTNISGFRGLESRDFNSQNINHKQFPKMQIEKNVELAFYDFGFRGFKCQATTHNNSRILKVKGCGTNTSGFWVSRFQGFKCQTISHTNP